MLHALGVRLRRLRHRHLQATPEEQAALVAELEALVPAWPEAWELLCVEEATVRRHPTLTAHWGLGDDVPEVPTGDDQAKVQGYGAVAPLTGRPHDHISPALGQRACAPCLPRRLAYEPCQRLLVIHDRGAQHTGAPREAVIRDAGGRLMLKPQPASSPEWTPQERRWEWRRRVVPRHYWVAPLHAPIDALRHVCRSLAGVKAQVRRFCSVTTPESLVA